MNPKSPLGSRPNAVKADGNNEVALEIEGQDKVKIVNIALEMVTLKDKVLELKAEGDRKENLLKELKEILNESERLQNIAKQRQRELMFLLLHDESLRELILSAPVCQRLEDLLSEDTQK